MDVIFTEYTESMKGRIEKGYILPTQDLLFDYVHILKEASAFSEILLTKISQKTPAFTVKDSFFFSIKSAPAFQKRIDLFCNEITALKKLNYRILILAGGHTRCERMVKELEERNISSFFSEDFEKPISKGSIMITPGKLDEGFPIKRLDLLFFQTKNSLEKEAGKKA